GGNTALRASAEASARPHCGSKRAGATAKQSISGRQRGRSLCGVSRPRTSSSPADGREPKHHAAKLVNGRLNPTVCQLPQTDGAAPFLLRFGLAHAAGVEPPDLRDRRHLPAPTAPSEQWLEGRPNYGEGCRPPQK